MKIFSREKKKKHPRSPHQPNSLRVSSSFRPADALTLPLPQLRRRAPGLLDAGDSVEDRGLPRQRRLPQRAAVARARGRAEELFRGLPGEEAAAGPALDLPELLLLPGAGRRRRRRRRRGTGIIDHKRHVDEARAGADSAPPLDQDPLAKLPGAQREDERREQGPEPDLRARGVGRRDVRRGRRARSCCRRRRRRCRRHDR